MRKCVYCHLFACEANTCRTYTWVGRLFRVTQQPRVDETTAGDQPRIPQIQAILRIRCHQPRLATTPTHTTGCQDYVSSKQNQTSIAAPIHGLLLSGISSESIAYSKSTPGPSHNCNETTTNHQTEDNISVTSSAWARRHGRDHIHV